MLMSLLVKMAVDVECGLDSDFLDAFLLLFDNSV